MIRLILFCLLVQFSLAHEIEGNKAKITINYGSISLNLAIHENKWTKNYKTHELDDVILDETELKINDQRVSLKLKKISKYDGHYEIQYITSTNIKENIKSISLSLPKSLGRVVVTVIRAKTQLVDNGKKAYFRF